MNGFFFQVLGQIYRTMGRVGILFDFVLIML